MFNTKYTQLHISLASTLNTPLYISYLAPCTDSNALVFSVHAQCMAELFNVERMAELFNVQRMAESSCCGEGIDQPCQGAAHWDTRCCCCCYPIAIPLYILYAIPYDAITYNNIQYRASVPCYAIPSTLGLFCCQPMHCNTLNIILCNTSNTCFINTKQYHSMQRHEAQQYYVVQSISLSGTRTEILPAGHDIFYTQFCDMQGSVL